MAKSKNVKGVTPIGEVLYAHILKTEQIRDNDSNTVKDTGKFTIQLKFSEKDKKAFMSKVTDEWLKYETELQNNKKLMKAEPSLGMKEVNEDEYFKFAMNESIKLKDGSTLHRTCPIFDSKGTPCEGKITSIGNGTKAKVAYELVPFYMNKTTYGISLRLTALQIIELKEYTQDAASFGFGVEENGFDVTAAEIDVDEDVPTVDEEDDDDEGDF